MAPEERHKFGAAYANISSFGNKCSLLVILIVLASWDFSAPIMFPLSGHCSPMPSRCFMPECSNELNSKFHAEGVALLNF